MAPTRENDIQAPVLEEPLERRYALGVTIKTHKIDKPKDDGTKDPVAVALGRRISEIRRSEGMTQDDVANWSGIDRRFVSALERGDKNPTLRALARVSDALGVTLADLFAAVPGYGKRVDNHPYVRKVNGEKDEAEG